VWYLCSVPNLVQISVIVTEIDAHMLPRAPEAIWQVWRSHIFTTDYRLYRPVRLLLEHSHMIYFFSHSHDIVIVTPIPTGIPWTHVIPIVPIPMHISSVRVCVESESVCVQGQVTNVVVQCCRALLCNERRRRWNNAAASPGVDEVNTLLEHAQV